jgi:hypothetical protein
MMLNRRKKRKKCVLKKKKRRESPRKSSNSKNSKKLFSKIRKSKLIPWKSWSSQRTNGRLDGSLRNFRNSSHTT